MYAIFIIKDRYTTTTDRYWSSLQRNIYISLEHNIYISLQCIYHYDISVSINAAYKSFYITSYSLQRSLKQSHQHFRQCDYTHIYRVE